MDRMSRASRGFPTRLEDKTWSGSFARLASWAVVVALVGCASTPHRHRHRPRLEDEPEAPPVKVEPWTELPSLGAFTPVGEPRVSNHRLADEVGQVKVNAAAAAYADHDPLPPGAIVVETLSPDAGAAPTAIFVMQKREAGYFPGGGDWEYLVLDGQGGVQARGQLPRCARCHAEAPDGFLFRAAVGTKKKP